MISLFQSHNSSHIMINGSHNLMNTNKLMIEPMSHERKTGAILSFWLATGGCVEAMQASGAFG